MNKPRFRRGLFCAVYVPLIEMGSPRQRLFSVLRLFAINKELFMNIRRFYLPPVSGAWRLVFAEEFNGTNLNPKVWMKLRGAWAGLP